MRGEVRADVAGALDDIEDARREAGKGVNFGEELGVEGGEFGGFVDYGVAGGEAGGGFPEGAVSIR